MSTKISLLPPECLAEILSYVKVDGIDITDPMTYPVNLYLVCKAWRAIALSTAELWSRIRVDIDRYEAVHTPPSPEEPPTPTEDRLMHSTILNTLKSCLDRSKLQPLTICIRARSLLPSHQTDSSSVNTEISNKRKDLLGSILVVLLHNSNRWFDVDFDFPLDLFVFILPSGRNYPLLRRLVIGRGSGNLQADWLGTNIDSLLSTVTPIRGTFSNAPQLIQLELCGLPICISQLSLPWHQITHLELSLHDIFTHGRHFIRNMGQLISLKLCQLSTGPLPVDLSHLPLAPSTEQLVSIECANLEELSLVCRREIPQSATMFFSTLRIPRLTMLQIQSSLSLQHNNLGEWIPAFRTCISRSDCPVRRLTLKKMDGATALAVLGALPDIKDLVLEEIHFTNKLMSGLTYPRHSKRRSVSLSPSKAPLVGTKISRLVVHKPRFINDIEGPNQFMNMIRSRLPVHTSPSVQTSEQTGAPYGSRTKAPVPGASLAALRVTGVSPRRLEPTLDTPGGSSVTLYQLLVQQVLKYNGDIIRVEPDEEGELTEC
ncbi:hypothetical protein D9756_006925 [Leucocoprinus leucothites]|uniref:F-box domain-containing protein n=1 Tax=Leucocoprinus leucothites TaxID=201217 RepID=A0A8H5D5Z8_9AGAR|nr:hypothetical protein D9756_006925 [Leucoagaricus leucothites]